MPLRVPPHLIVTYGPAGSGKGFLRQNYQEWLEEIYGPILRRIVQLEIDNYVEKDETYIEKATEITTGYIRAIRDNKSDDEVTIAQRAAIEASLHEGLVNDLAALYMRVRQFYNAQLDLDLEDAFANGDNVIFETTGANSIKWLLDMAKESSYPYIITIVYPLVQRKTILGRAEERFLKRKMCLQQANGDEWLEKCEPPRLPAPSVIMSGIGAAQKNLVSLMADPTVDHILLYNNNPHCDSGTCFRIDIGHQATKTHREFWGAYNALGQWMNEYAASGVEDTDLIRAVMKKLWELMLMLSGLADAPGPGEPSGGASVSDT